MINNVELLYLCNLDEILLKEDSDFIEAAYLKFLNRAPDEAGNNYYQKRIRSGVEKIEIIYQIRYSKEGRTKDIRLKNLTLAIIRFRLLRVPILGSVFRFMGLKNYRPAVGVSLQQLSRNQAKIQLTLREITGLLNTQTISINTNLKSNFLEISALLENPSKSLEKNRPVSVTDTIKTITWCILCTKHTYYIAHIIAKRLHQHNWLVEITTEQPECYLHDMYIVICAQMFSNLPPEEKRIIYQMEQSVSSRWFTDDYLSILNNSRAILEYSLNNIDFLSKMGILYPHVNYLPVGADLSYLPTFSRQKKEFDVVFYGDHKSSPRRQTMLNELGCHFNLKICSEVFGRDLIEIISKAKVIINIHYYENALLEMPRLQECISLGVPIVSEDACDIDDYPELGDAVTFFRSGSIQDMIDKVRRTLASPPPETVLKISALTSARRFEFMLDRFLVSQKFLSASYLRKTQINGIANNDHVILSMPETIQRRRVLEEFKPRNFCIFDGIKYSPGWVGCGLSYATLAQNAIENGLSRLTVMEDDALLPDDFDEHLNIINDYLDHRRGGWDVFAGVIASLDNKSKIIDVDDYKGFQFVTIDKMTSMVFNIYNHTALKILSNWHPDLGSVESNTIDRYLENQINLRVVVLLPFFVGHREEVSSTLWGFQNTQYRDMISESEALLRKKVDFHLKNRKLGNGSGSSNWN